MARTKEEVAENRRLWRLENKDRILEQQRAATKRYRAKHPEKVKALIDAYRIENKEILAAKTKAHRDNKRPEINQYNKEYYANNRERLLLSKKVRIDEIREYKAQNKEKIAQGLREWNIRNRVKLRPKRAAGTAKYRLAKMHRTPTWLSETDLWMIEEIYMLSELRTRLTGVECNVDHIIPLRGKKVSGLHVPSNLQIIPAKVNFVKGNRYAHQSST